MLASVQHNITLSHQNTTCCVSAVLLQTRVLALQVAELEGSIHMSKASMPDLPGIDRDIAILKADLLRVRPPHSLPALATGLAQACVLCS